MPGEHGTPGALEGRLIAQRRVLAMLVAAVLDDKPAAVRERLARLVSRDAVDGAHSEDPGAVPDLAFGLLSAEDDEIRAIADRVAAIRAAPDQ